MSSYGHEHTGQAPSGSRLAQYLNGRVPPANPTNSSSNAYGEQQRFQPSSNNGAYGQARPLDDILQADLYDQNYPGGNMYGLSAGPEMSDVLGVRGAEELASAMHNIPHMGLSLFNDETIRHRLNGQNCGSFFADGESRARLMQRQLAQQVFTPPPNDLPDVVEPFRCLRAIGRNPVNRMGPHLEHVYRAVSMADGQAYTLHRVTSMKALNPYHTQQLDIWRRIHNSNISRFHNVFPAPVFNDSSYIFAYDFQPLAEPIVKHFFNINGALKPKFAGPTPTSINEQIAWYLIIQMSNAIRQIHSFNIAGKCFDTQRILVNAQGRFIVSGCGIAESLMDQPSSYVHAQVEDLRSLGAVLVGLMTGNMQPFPTHEHVLLAAQQIDQRYSPDLRNVAKLLCTAQVNGQRVSSINEVMPMIGARFYIQIEALQIRSDMVENDLCKELQNGRLFRLLTMLNTVTDRNLPKEPYWAETSERYMLKLFREYVFHQVDPYCRPVADLAHIVSCLNKLDSGSPENIQLVSNESLVIISYKDLRLYLEASFSYLKREMDPSLIAIPPDETQHSAVPGLLGPPPQAPPPPNPNTGGPPQMIISAPLPNSAGDRYLKAAAAAAATGMPPMQMQGGMGGMPPPQMPMGAMGFAPPGPPPYGDMGMPRH